MKNVFHEEDKNELVRRIQKLTPDTRHLWGKMTVAQMLAHCCVSYEMVYDNIHPKPGAIMRFVLKIFIKKAVVGEKSYPRNGPTAPAFLIREDRNFEEERQRLINYLDRTFQLGEAHFEGRESNSFGPLTGSEWNIMFYKHLDHHLTQFGI